LFIFVPFQVTSINQKHHLNNMPLRVQLVLTLNSQWISGKNT